AHQRRLAAAVRTQQGNELSARHAERDVVQRVAPHARVAERDVPHLENQYAVHRLSSNAKRGTPTSAVTMPTGSSRGATTVRASVSARTSSVPPARNDGGRSRRGRPPPGARPECGALSPTHRIPPAPATAPAVRNDAAR